jgi:phosphatidate cytidylyltransferase
MMQLLAPVILTVLGVLIAGSLATLLLRWRKPDHDWSELAARVRSWWWMSALFFSVVLLGGNVGVVFFAFLSYWALKEYITVLRTRPADHYGLVVAFLSVPIQYIWIGTDWYGMFAVFIPVYVFILLGIRQVLSGETKGFVAATAQIHWGLMAFVYGVGHMAYLLRMPTPTSDPASPATGASLLVFLAFVVQISDVSQYVWGKSLGRHKVMPRVSPNKTWEGLVGGALTATAFGVALRFLTPFSLIECVWVGLMVTLLGFFGGAVMSAVKRDLEVKDFGELVPGHGGMIDRIDSLTFAVPIFFHYVRYFHYH